MFGSSRVVQPSIGTLDEVDEAAEAESGWLTRWWVASTVAEENFLPQIGHGKEAVAAAIGTELSELSVLQEALVVAPPAPLPGTTSLFPSPAVPPLTDCSTAPLKEWQDAQ